MSRRQLGQAVTVVLVASALSLVIGLTYFYGMNIPVYQLPGTIWTARAIMHLDTPVGAVSKLLPAAWRSGFSLMFRSGTYCFPDPFKVERARYLRIAVPTWTILLCGVYVAFRALRRSGRRGASA